MSLKSTDARKRNCPLTESSAETSATICRSDYPRFVKLLIGHRYTSPTINYRMCHPLREIFN